ncbi:glutamate 5-kinase [Limosilactobacillus sp. STM2_1]|uniref:Glutamate 5-kinase n=1 Tax=Limosilactobacillus rudii TaxID=2759755 RepID=A0A7W3UNT8_9LACO|nr:glutamate 5-kinase [Limosilactobacillus rudii]MBB1080379.1 glutamate 5-kinase [Limosilactobacillus rudii]MBB1098405.1 glutamate 5-kinase [Limosilactobacillus rudii]MCD7135413.1 glutamate 5-kinase [Limosilactobacillus rudii]
MTDTHQRVVVKIGTSSLVLPNGRINLKTIDQLSFTLATLNNQGYELILVSSGAIGVGLASLGLKNRPAEIAKQQALASIGQAELMRIYSQRFLDYQTHVAQLLLTRDVLDFPVSRRHTLNTISTLLKQRVIPIVNENDPVSVDELDHYTTFSDNDELSAQVATAIDADRLIVLSDIDGLYDKDPHKFSNAQIIRKVATLTPEIKAAASGSSTRFGTGGMVTKLRAAATMMQAGKQMILCSGKNPKILFDIFDGQTIGTHFGK